MPSSDFARECATLVKADFRTSADLYERTFQMRFVDAYPHRPDRLAVEWEDLRSGEVRRRTFKLGDASVPADVVAMGIMDELLDGG